MTHTTITPSEEAPDCDCGALLKQGQTRCSKCLARDRWARGDKARRHAAKRRALPRRLSRVPLSAAASRVSWS
ncbi:hypothetical protein GCM10009530_56690 [Microbispora corallina]|uniref:Uncharacterized protein n=1 Tax=Microbispora corallina TaxID=83302 RepID=A0ABQ4G905_9ACTN|nr:hypothetical protein [Microbispora corallina]GIH43509.1 hypothetical protein Mco01_65090 [Microbispora corallina]